jgi:hypothetical protein
LIAEFTLPSDWLSAASGGLKSMAGTWQATASLAGTNTPGYFRIKDAAGTTTHIQGSVSAVGGGGQMELDSMSVAQNQTLSVVSFQIGAGNA